VRAKPETARLTTVTKARKKSKIKKIEIIKSIHQLNHHFYEK